MHRIAPIMLVIAGLVHLIPLTGLFGPDQLTLLYGVAISEPNLIILMRHRTVLLALVGLLMVAAAFRSDLRVAAYVGGAISIGSFLALTSSGKPYNALIERVVAVDAGAAICVAAAIITDVYLHTNGAGRSRVSDRPVK